MYKFIESSEDLEHSLPVVGANILNVLNVYKNRMSIYTLIEKTLKLHPDYGYETITESLVFLYTISALDMNGAYVEVSNDYQ